VRGHYQIRLVFFILICSMAAFAGTAFKATTTLTAETSNNTSAADTFAAQSNGNAGAGNVSKLPLRNLLYSGSSARMYTNFLPWFGFGDHMVVGYTSNTSAQVHKQVVDMISRGLDGAIIDWFGQGTFNTHFVYYDQSSQILMHEAELYPGFNFAIMDDAGSLKACAALAGCDLTQTLINDLTYAYNTYENSPAYLRYNNQPVVFFFGHEAYTLDWTRVRASVPGNPLFIFRNPGGFSYAQSNGGFSWVAPETVSATNSMALGYLDYYDKTAISLIPAYSLESSYKGFNDTLAAWTANRVIGQQCGATWLQTMAENGKYYSSLRQMIGVQIVTWNDYEEGTEIESGIDNCVSISASVTGTVASWSITGQLNTIDHYRVFISQDGENLMWLADAPAGATSMDLAQFTLNSGSYTVFVQAVGRPSITNKMSAGVPVTLSNLPPVAALSITPASGIAPVTVVASAAGSSDPDGTIAGTVINFGDGSAGISASSASHVYSAAGTYIVTATVTDNLGATSTTSATVVVTAPNQPPIAALSLSSTVAYGPATITASTAASSDPDGAIAGASINFGDGSSAAGPTASHTYSTAGVYTVTATVTDNAGASSSASSTITVKSPEVIVSSPSDGITTTLPVQVVAGGCSGYMITAMQIYVDGALSYSVNASTLNTTVLLAGGAHTLIIKGWDSSGHSFMQSLTVNMVANKPPLAVVSTSAASLLVGGSITASTSGSSDPDGTITGISIDFGDGTIANAASASHQYKTAGIYSVKATVTDNLGASTTASTSVTVRPQFVTISSPTAGFVSSTVEIKGVSRSGYPIAATQVYIDGSLRYKTSSASVDTFQSISSGSHVIVVQGWDTSGATFKSQVTVTR